MTKRRAPLSVRIPDELYPLMEQQADRLGLTRNQFVVMAVKAAVHALPNLPSPDQAVKIRTPMQEYVEKQEASRVTHAALPEPVAPEPADVWSQDSPGNVKEHKWHSFEVTDEDSIEYRNGIRYAYLKCECGKLSPVKMKVRG